MLRRLAMRRRVAGAEARDAKAAVLAPGRDVLSAATDDGAVLLDLRREVFFGLDEVGAVIWAGVREGATRTDIAGRLREHYDVPPHEALEDVDRFVGELLDRGLAVER